MLDRLTDKKKIKPYAVDLMPHDPRVLKANISDLPFNNESFDTIICSAVIEHVKDQAKVLKEFHRVLKNNGRIIFTTPNPIYSIGAQIASYLGFKYKEGYDNSLFLSALCRLATNNGFEIEEARGFLLLPGFTPFSGHTEKLNAMH